MFAIWVNVKNKAAVKRKKKIVFQDDLYSLVVHLPEWQKTEESFSSSHTQKSFADVGSKKKKKPRKKKGFVYVKKKRLDG